MQGVVVNTEKPSWSKCREQMSVECLTIIETPVLYTTYPQASENITKRIRKMVRTRGRASLRRNGLFWTLCGPCTHRTTAAKLLDKVKQVNTPA